MKFQVAFLFVACFSLAYGQLIWDGLTRGAEKNFRNGAEKVPSLESHGPEDNLFFKALQRETKDTETQIFVEALNQAMANFGLELADAFESGKQQVCTKP